MDRDDIFGDIFERVEEVVIGGVGALIGRWYGVLIGVVFIILYWFKWVCIRFNVRLCGKCSSASTTEFVIITGFECPR